MPEIRKHPEELEAVAAIVAATLIRRGFAREEAEAAASDVVTRICATWPAQRLYIPRNPYTLEYMRSEIRRRWHGGNDRELCREFNIGENRLRQIAQR